jgi:hypothetical protein
MQVVHHVRIAAGQRGGEEIRLLARALSFALRSVNERIRTVGSRCSHRPVRGAAHSARPAEAVAEANLGLATVAEVCAALLELRALEPVIGVIAGALGCFAGMSIAAGLAPDWS